MVSIASYASFQSLFDREPTETEVVAWVAQLSLTDCLHAIGKLGHALASEKPAAQKDLLDSILLGLPLEQQHRLAQTAAGGRRWLFSRQLLALARVALLHAPRRDPDSFRDSQDWPKFVFALLAVADIYDTLGQEAETVDHGLEAEEWFCSARLRRVGMPPCELRHTLARTFRVFVDLPERRPELVTAGRPSDRFEQEVGPPLERYLAIVLGAHTRFAAWNGLSEEWTLTPAWWSSTSIELDDVTRALATVSATPAELESELREHVAQGKTSLDDVRPFLVHPLVRVNESDGFDSYVPLDLATLDDAMLGDGLFWRMKPAGVDATDKEKSDFGESLGRLLEAHCLDVVDNAYKSRLKRHGSFFREFRYKEPTATGEQAHDSPDVIVTDRKASVFIEIGVDRFNVRDTIGSGDMESFRRDIRKILLHRAVQLDRKITHAREGVLPLQGAPGQTFDHIYPVVCLWDGFPLGNYLYDRILATVGEKNYLKQPGVQPLRIVSVEEFELICALVAKGESMSEIFRAHGRSAYSKEPVGDFLRDRYRGQLDLPEPIKSEFGGIISRIQAQLFQESPEGLP